MKLPIQIAACLLLVAAQGAICSAQSVEVIGTPLKSGSVMRIVVAFNGKPVPGTKVEFYKQPQSAIGKTAATGNRRLAIGENKGDSKDGNAGYGAQVTGDRKGNTEEDEQRRTPVLTLTCDEHGWIKTPKLADGRYELVAHTEDNLQASLVLDVSSRDGTMAFEMDLRPAFFDRLSFELAHLDKVPITKRLQVFRGTIKDPSGAVLPNASIQIVRRSREQLTGNRKEQSAHEAKVVKRIKSGSDGEFEAQLHPGTYVANFIAPGFKTFVVGFEIVPDGSSRLDVKLDIAPVSEEVAIGNTQ